MMGGAKLGAKWTIFFWRMKCFRSPWSEKKKKNRQPDRRPYQRDWHPARSIDAEKDANLFLPSRRTNPTLHAYMTPQDRRKVRWGHSIMRTTDRKNHSRSDGVPLNRRGVPRVRPPRSSTPLNKNTTTGEGDPNQIEGRIEGPQTLWTSTSGSVQHCR